MTAVEFLIKQLTSIGELQIPEGSNVVTSIIQQAIEKEKDQIIDAVFFGIHLQNNKIDSPIERAEQYYNETFSNPSD